MASPSLNFTTIEETTKHPAYPSTIWTLEPDRHGLLSVAKDRGGPLNISWQIHGVGPTKLVLIMGLAGACTSWQRQTRYFGHDRRDKYSVLILDNRGIGDSDKLVSRYSTSAMAGDVIEIMDHVGWIAEREVHLVGISLGGMIAQEVACAIPTRLRSLSLLCTSAEVKNTQTYSGWAAERLGFLVPKKLEIIIQETARKIFTDEWLMAPDAENLPSPTSTPKCLKPFKGAEYRLFENNFQRFQAQEIAKRSKPGYFTVPGFLCQLIAAGWHRKSDEQLEEMADKIGRENIMVMHGKRDQMILPSNGEHLIKTIEPGTALMVDGMGHAPVMEKQKWFNETMEERFEAWSKL